MTGKLIIADASRVTPLAFMDAIGMSSPEQRAESKREMEEQCIRAIERGDTYGWPPSMVAECRKIIAARIPLTDVEDLGPGRIAA